MKKGSLLAVEMTVPPGQEEACERAAEAVLGRAPVFYTEAKSGRTTATFYLSKARAWTNSVETQLLQALKKEAPGPWRFRTKRVVQQDWANSWKASFRPLQFGKILRVQGSWSTRLARLGEVVIRIDPGLSFGTGQHPTTAYCLSEIVRYRPIKGRIAMLDAGAGSAILAISARALGYGPVLAVENDPVAVRMARRSVRLNRLSGKVPVRCLDLHNLPQKAAFYGLICANLTTEVLMRTSEILTRSLSKEGVLVVAGVLDREFAALRRHFEQRGLRLLRSRREKEWRSGTFLKNLRNLARPTLRFDSQNS